MEMECRVRQEPLFEQQRERSEAFGALLVQYLLSEDGVSPEGSHPLTGLVRCGRCGGRMTLYSNGEDGLFRCCRCGGAGSTARGCNISAARLWDETAAGLSRFASAWGEPDRLVRLALEAREGWQLCRGDTTQRRNRALSQAMWEYLQDKSQEKDTLYWKRAQGEIDPMDFLEQRHQLWREQSLVERNLSELEDREQRGCQALEEHSRELLCTLQAGADGLSNRLLRLLLHEAAVKPRDKSGMQLVWLYWNF